MVCPLRNHVASSSRTPFSEIKLIQGSAVMTQSLVQDYKHFVFSTKRREPYLIDSAFRYEMHAYLGGWCERHDGVPLAIGGVQDHVHLLCRFPKSMTVEDFVREIKKSSSRWAKIRSRGRRPFYWQGGYGAFSVSPSHVGSLKEYIGRQEEHHRFEDFQDEYRRLLRKYGLEWDERYLWD
jgi:REP element-mobilizing transposase RayT